MNIFFETLLNLNSNYIEFLITPLLTHLEKNPINLFAIQSILLKISKYDSERISSVYRIAIGIANILLSGKKDKTEFDNATFKFTNEE